MGNIVNIDGQEIFGILEQIFIKSEVGTIQDDPSRLSTFVFNFKGQRLHATLIHRLNRNNEQNYFNLHVTEGPRYRIGSITNIYFTIWGFKKESEHKIHLYGDINYTARNQACKDLFESEKTLFLQALQHLISDIYEIFYVCIVR